MINKASVGNMISMSFALAPFSAINTFKEAHSPMLSKSKKGRITGPYF